MAAGRIKGITIEIGGNTTGLDRSLKSVNGTIKSTETQLKDVERLLKLDPKNTVLLTQKQKLLEQEIGTTREKLDGLKQANEQVSKTAKNYDAWKEKYEPIKAEIDETKTKLDELKKRSADAEKELASGKISQEKYDALQSEIAETEDKLKSLKKDAKAVDDEFGKPISPKQYDALQREIIETENKLKSLEGGAGKTKTALEKVSDALGSAGGKLDSAANKVMPVSVAVGGIATAGLKVAADFESGMSQVQAITGATGDEFDALREKAVDLGVSTSFSSNEVATAMAEMGKAGWDTQQIMDGMEGVLAAAAASGEGLSSVSTIVADAITGFKLEASDATKVADLLTQAANSGTIDINDLGESFKYVAPVAETMGFSIEDCTTALSAMSTAGIKGSQAGTSLRTAFLNMAKPTKPVAAAMDEISLSVTNADGSFKSMDEILAEMRTSMAGMTDEQKAQILATIAGKDAVAGLSAVLNMSQEEYDKLASSMDNSAGVAKKTASVMQDNLKSKIEQLGGALESLAIKLSETVIPWLTDFVENLTGMIDKFTEMPKGAQKMITALGGIVIAAGPTTKALGGVFNAVGFLITALSSPVGIAVAAATAAAGLIALTAAAYDGTNEMHLDAEATHDLADEQDALTDEINKNRKAREDSLQASETEAAQAEAYMGKLKDLMGVEGKSAEQKRKIKYYVEKLNETLPDLNLKYDEEKDKLNKSTKAIKENIEARKLQARLDAYGENYNASVAEGVKLEDERDKLSKQHKENLKAQARAQEEYDSVVHKSGQDWYSYWQAKEKAQKTLDETTTAVEESGAALDQNSTALSENAAETEKWSDKIDGALDTQAMQKSLDELGSKAKEAGVKIPQSVAEGMESGKYAIPETVDGLKNLIAFDSAIQKAGLSGAEIPPEMASGILSGKISVEEAVAELKKASTSGLSPNGKAAKPGEMTSDEYAQGALRRKSNVNNAAQSTKSAALSGLSPNGKAAKPGAQSADEYAQALRRKKTNVDSAASTMTKGIPVASGKSFDAAKRRISTETGAAVTTVSRNTRKMEGSFSGMSLKLPHIKLPHFSLTGKFSLSEMTVPHLSVSWYKTGGIFNNPSIIGVGEAGPEAVLPIEKLNVMFDRMADSIISGVGTLMRANSGGPSGDVHLDVYLYPNGPKYGEEIVKTYDTYKRRLG